MTIASRAEGSSVKQYHEVRIVAPDRVVADSGRAGLLRHQFLDPIEDDIDLANVPVVIDLNNLHVVTPDAADELVVRWLERVRTPRRPVVAAIATFSRGIGDAIHWALRDAKQAAYLVRSAPIGEVPRPVGEVTDTQIETLEKVRSQEQGRATAKQIGETMDLMPTAAANRLSELVGKGLLLRQAQSGKVGDLFVYPWPAVTRQAGSDFIPFNAHNDVANGGRNGNGKDVSAGSIPAAARDRARPAGTR